MKKIAPLKKGDQITIISPAGCIKDKAALDKAVSFFEKKGYKVKVSKNALAQKDYLAGDDALRLEDIHEAFTNPETKAILCSRGGYGCSRLLPQIDCELIKNNPKFFLGHSDITAFLNFFPIPTFHAPMAIFDFGCENIDPITQKSFFDVLNGIKPPYIFEAMPKFETVSNGISQGKLYGGNLSVLVSLLGTRFFPNTKNNLLLIEDLNEPLYKIDRMLTQLKLSGIFEQVSGVIFAGFGETQVTTEFLKSFLPQQCPAIKGFYASHEKCKYTLPFQVEYKFDANLGTLELMENCIE